MWISLIPGLIGRRREEKLWSARVAADIQISIWVRLLALSRLRFFSRLTTRVQVTHTL
jgi:hypothetical protein